MKLIKTEIKELVRSLEGGGLLTANLRYKTTDASGELDYKGPKMPREMWEQILSFFKWTYDTDKSESQVRLFVSEKLGTWKAWAFPQSSSCGLSTKELDNDDSKKQRAALFENDSDWTAFGTVHHHCGISAFQSGTDETDEKTVAGLHITVGDMDKPQHSLHARFYYQGDLYEPDMSKFFNVGFALDQIPEFARRFMSLNMADLLAREAMCQPSSAEFPAQWKENFIRQKTGAMLTPWDWDSAGSSKTHSKYGDLPDPAKYTEGEYEFDFRSGEQYRLTGGKWVKQPSFNNHVSESCSEESRINKAVEEIRQSVVPLGMEQDEELMYLEELDRNEYLEEILDACVKNNVDFMDVIKEMIERIQRPTMELEKNPNDPNWYGVE